MDPLDRLRRHLLPERTLPIGNNPNVNNAVEIETESTVLERSPDLAFSKKYAIAA